MVLGDSFLPWFLLFRLTGWCLFGGGGKLSDLGGYLGRGVNACLVFDCFFSWCKRVEALVDKIGGGLGAGHFFYT